MLDELTLLGSAVAGASAVGGLWAVYLHSLVRVPPNRALVLYGRRAPRFPAEARLGASEVDVHRPRIVVGGRVLVPPWNKGVAQLSLDPISVDLSIRSLTPTTRGRATGWEVQLRIQAKIPAEPTALTAAAENLLGRSADDVKALIRRAVEGVVPSVLSRLKPEEGAPDWDRLASEIQASAAGELVISGLVVQSLTLTDLRPIAPTDSVGWDSARTRSGAVVPTSPVRPVEGATLGRLESRLSRSENDLQAIGAALAHLYRSVATAGGGVAPTSVLDIPLGVEMPSSPDSGAANEGQSYDSTVGASALPARTPALAARDGRETERNLPLS